MNKINRKVEYAFMALKYMMQKTPGELTAVKSICDEFGTPFDPMAKVMQCLVHAHILKSEQGKQGGYLIVKDLKKVSFYELNEVIIGPVEVIKCLKASEPCEFIDNCNIQSPLTVLNEKLIQFYKSISIYELLVPNKGELRKDNMPNIAAVAEKWT